MGSHSYPAGGSGSAYWGDAVASVGSLPPSGAVAGECRLVLDVDDIYEWNGSSWEKITNNTALLGPGSSTDNAFARWDGTGATTLQDSTGATLSDTGVATFAGVIDNSTTASRALTTNGSKQLASSATTATELGYVSGVTSAIQTQLDGKEPTVSLTASRALQSSSGGGLEVSSVTSTELGYISGVTSAIQTQITARLQLAGGTMTGDLTLAGDPDSALKAATKQYVDSVAAGLDVKDSVQLLSASNITLSGEQTIDGTLTSASRVLVTGQTAPAENGIYVTAAGAWSRATDMDSWDEVPGSFVFVEEGSTYADTGWVCTADTGGTLETTSITWSQFAGAGTYTADGQGIELTGTQYGLELDGSTLSKSASGLKVADLGIANAQVNGSAAIALSKLAATTASRALVSDGSGFVSAATTTSTEIGYVNGVTSAIQTQLNDIRAGKGNVSVSSNVTLTDHRVHLVDTSTARSLELPTVGATNYVIVKDVTGSCGTNNITLTTAGSETIDGSATFVMTSDYESVAIVSDGTNYFVL